MAAAPTTKGGQPERAGGSAVPRLGLRFALRYAAMAAALFAIYGFPFELFGMREDWLHGYLAGYAKLAGAVLGLFERDLLVNDTIIRGRFALEIVRNCDAADVSILFVSATLALPAPLSKKAAPIALGLVALAAANITRICSLYYIGVLRPAWFKTAHEEAWPLLLVALTAALFLASRARLQRSNRGLGS